MRWKVRLMLKFILMMNLNKMELLDSDKMPVASNKILVVCNGVFQGTLNPLKRIFSSLDEYKMGKKFLKFGDIQIKKRKFNSFNGLIDIDDASCSQNKLLCKKCLFRSKTKIIGKIQRNKVWDYEKKKSDSDAVLGEK